MLVRSDVTNLIVVFWWNLLPDGEFDERILHKISTTEEIWSANVFINEGLWRPSWWEAS